MKFLNVQNSKLNQKWGKSLKNLIPLKIILLGFVKLNQIFMNIMKKIQVDKNGSKYILFRIDVYSNKFLLAVEIVEKGHTDRDLIFEDKRQKALERKLGCKFIRINTSNAKNGYDFDYEVGNIEAFIDEFKNKKIKELEKKLIEEKEMREKLEKEIREMRNETLKHNSKKLNNLTNNY